MSDASVRVETNLKPTSRRAWFRFSLGQLLLATVILLLGVSHWRTSQDLYWARRELGIMRRSHGIVEVGDRSKIHVMAVSGLRFQQWKWRVYWPAGLPCRLSTGFTVPGRRYEKPQAEYALHTEQFQPDSQFTLDAHIEQLGDGRFELVLFGPFGERHYPIPQERPMWLERGASHDWRQAGLMGSDFFQPHETVELIWLRHQPGPGRGRVGDDYRQNTNTADDANRIETSGLLMWLDVPNEQAAK